MKFIYVETPDGQKILHNVANIARVFTETTGYGKLSVVAQLLDKPSGTVTPLYIGDDADEYISYIKANLDVIDYNYRNKSKVTINETIIGLVKEDGSKEELPTLD
jgi:hypothetical protein